MLTHHSEEPLMRLLADQTRRGEVHGPALARAHREIGRLLAADVARFIELESVAIQHPTGAATGVRMVPGSEPILVALMRAGLFLAEGIWEGLGGGSLVPYHAGVSDLSSIPVAGRLVVVIDSVINSGRSIRGVIQALLDRHCRRLVVVTLVGYRPTLEAMSVEFPDLDLIAARLSDHSYVGRSGTDTGSRLFGTETWGLE